MFQLGSEAARQAPQFVPDGDNQGWILDTLAEFGARFGEISRKPRLLTSPPGGVVPRDLDGLLVHHRHVPVHDLLLVHHRRVGDPYLLLNLGCK